jgi:hypothetical protein
VCAVHSAGCFGALVAPIASQKPLAFRDPPASICRVLESHIFGTPFRPVHPKSTLSFPRVGVSILPGLMVPKNVFCSAGMRWWARKCDASRRARRRKLTLAGLAAVSPGIRVRYFFSM